MPLIYSTAINIALPRDKVVEIYQDPDQNVHWMEGFDSSEPVSGEPGAVGATSRILIKMGKREFDMTETILGRVWERQVKI